MDTRNLYPADVSDEEIAGRIWNALERPSAARMYDYLLGGSHNFAVDREAAQRLLTANPDARLHSRVNRAFLHRAVRYLVRHGIHQFLDIGSGIPTAGNVHEIALATNPRSHVVYVDTDPVAVQHSLDILRSVPSATAIQADARQPHYILTHSEVRRLLDFSRPVAVLLVALLHFILGDQEVQSLVGVLRDALAPGSYLVVSHVAYDDGQEDIVGRAQEALAQASNAIRVRSKAEIGRFFDGLELVDPGLVWAPQWQPETPHDLFLDRPGRSALVAGAARKVAGCSGDRRDEGSSML